LFDGQCKRSFAWQFGCSLGSMAGFTIYTRTRRLTAAQRFVPISLILCAIYLQTRESVCCW
jgi:hypothetical protein